MNKKINIYKLFVSEKQIKCPICGNIITIVGHPLEKIIINCPQCKTKGYFIIPKDEKIKKSIIQLSISSILILISINLSHFLFIDNELLIFLSFLFLIPLFSYFNFDEKIIILFAILILILSVISLSFYKDKILANHLIIYVYWLLVVGVLCQLIRFLKRYHCFS